jgi:hypothetical protein
MGLGSEIRKKTCSGSRVKRHGVPDPQHWVGSLFSLCVCRKMRADLEDSEEKVRGLRSSLETAYRQVRKKERKKYPFCCIRMQKSF